MESQNLNQAKKSLASGLTPIQQTILLALAVFLCNLGARWGAIEAFGSLSPYWDEWDAQGTGFLKPWVEGDLSFADLFRNHNEHRIVFTRLLTWALFTLNGNEWNPVLEMSVNAILYSFSIALFFVLTTRGLRPSIQFFLAVFLLLLTAPSFGWENTLSGFQSQFTFVFLFSITALYAFHRYQGSILGPAIGLGCFLLAYLSFSTGLIVLPTAIVFLLYCLHRGLDPKKGWGSVAIVVLALLGGFYLMPQVGPHESIMAKNPWEFLITFLRCLAWPFTTAAVLALIVQAPIIALAVEIHRRRKATTDLSTLLVAIGLLTMLIAAALAYGRSNGGSGPSPRYADLLIPGVFVNAIAVTQLNLVVPRRLRGIPLGCAYAAFISIGLLVLYIINLAPSLTDRYRDAQAWEVNVSAFVATRDPAQLTDAKANELPFPIARVEDFVSMLSDPTIVAMLPAEIRGSDQKPRLTAVFDCMRNYWYTVGLLGVLLMVIQAFNLRARLRSGVGTEG